MMKSCNSKKTFTKITFKVRVGRNKKLRNSSEKIYSVLTNFFSFQKQNYISDYVKSEDIDSYLEKYLGYICFQWKLYIND